MRYFIDTEFLEGTQKTFFGKTKPTIDLISIGMVDENGREFYAISKDFNLKETWNRWQQRTGEGDRNNIEPRLYWIRENVLKSIWKDLKNPVQDIEDAEYDKFNYRSMKYYIKKYGKTNKQIAKEVKDFCYKGCNWNYPNKENEIEFYAYFADYDWVAFCWLFGNMMNLPNGFPMYCKDLKQMLDAGYMNQEDKYEGMSRLDAYLKDIKKHKDYPTQSNEHNALDDAKWNLKLFNFLKI